MGWLGKVVVIPILLIGLLITLKSVEYYVPDFSRGFLSDKKDVFKGVYKIAFYLHIFFTPFVLLIGSVQIFFNRKKRGGKLHHFLGKLYVLLILLIVAPSGLIMSFHAFGGFTSILSFVLLSTVLFAVTYRSYKAIVAGNISKHRKNMIRSYLLVLSAIFLRILSFISIHYFDWEGENRYTLIAWASWLPSLVIYELWYFWNGKSKQKIKAEQKFSLP